MTSESYFIATRFSPSNSLLGRLVRRAVDDERRAASLYYVAVAVVGLSLLMVQYATWAWLHVEIQAEPMSTVALSFWSVQVMGALAFVGLCVVGFTSEIEIVVGERLQIRTGETVLAFDYATLSADVVDTQLFWDHYRKYDGTVSFVGQLAEQELLLLKRSDGRHIVIELEERARKMVVARCQRANAVVADTTVSAPHNVRITQTA